MTTLVDVLEELKRLRGEAQDDCNAKMMHRVTGIDEAIGKSLGIQLCINTIVKMLVIDEEPKVPSTLADIIGLAEDWHRKNKHWPTHVLISNDTLYSWRELGLIPRNKRLGCCRIDDIQVWEDGYAAGQSMKFAYIPE